MDRKLLTNHALAISKYIAKYYFPALLAIFFIAEIGLRLSHLVQSQPVIPEVSSTDPVHRILLVSDSILGTMKDNNEAAGKFVQKMNLAYKDKVSIAELFRGGMLTNEVEAQLEDRVRKSNSSTVILMIGKSDWVRGWVDRNLGQLAQTWIASLETSKLLLVIMVDIQKQLTSLWPDRIAIAEHRALLVPWKLYSTQDIRGIPAFESAMLEFPNSIRAIRALVHLYHLHSKIPEGIIYLEKLAALSAEAEFVRLQIANLKFDLERQTNGQVPSQTVTDWDEAIKSLPDQRLAFLARMRYLMRTRNAVEFGNHIRNMSPEQSDVLLPSTYSTLSRVIKKALSLGLRVIVLEYPSNHGLPLQRVLAKYDGQIELYESRKWLVDSIEGPRLVSAFKVDIEHLTPFGADFLAENMVRIYQNGEPQSSP
jgi:hypothetical protein